MTKRALLIGINYKNQSSQLNGCINDVKNIQNVLVNNCSYSPQNIRMLTDESSVQPTRSAIEENIRWLVSNCSPGDTLFFHYSGHGSQMKDTNGDEPDSLDEVIVPLDYMTKGVISDDWLFINMAQVVPPNVTLYAFFDCCHSGTIIDLRFNYRSLCTPKTGTIKSGMPFVFSDWTDRFTLSVNRTRETNGTVCMISGCQDPQTSADAHLNNTFQGAFTYCLIEFFKTNTAKMPDGTFKFSGNVKLRNILKELNARLDINGFSQDSQLSIGRSADLELTFNP